MIRLLAVLGAVVLLAGCTAKEGEEATTSAPPPSAAVTPDQARAIAKEAYIYGFPMVDNYRDAVRVLRRQSRIPSTRAAWNQIHNTPRVYTPEDKAIQTPNSDTPYSAVGAGPARRADGADGAADRTGPLLQLQFIDSYTYNFALRRQPHHRQRRRQVSWSPGRTGRVTSPRASMR